MQVQCSNQLSHEATDGGSWLFVGSNVSVMNESIMDEMTHEMLSNIEIYEMICEVNYILYNYPPKWR